MKKHLFLKSLWIAIGLLVTGLTTQVWASTYKITGNQPGWGTWVNMTTSTGGYYEYYKVTGNTINCKINTSASYDGAYGESYITTSFYGTNITDTWSNDGNINFYDGSDYYVLIFLPSTCINTTANPIVCASSALPGEDFYVAGESAWTGTNWTTTGTDNKMSLTSNVYSLTKSSVTAAAHQFKVATSDWRASWGSSAYDATNSKNVYSESDASDNISFTPAIAGNVTVKFDRSTKKVIIVCASPTITFDRESGSGGPSTQATYYNEATSSITPPTRMGYTFGGYWTGDNGTDTMVINSSGVWVKNVAKFTDNSSTAKWILRENRTLHAKWTPNVYTITYYDKGGSSYSGSNSALLPSSYTYGVGVDLVDGVKAGNTFEGWYTASDCSSGKTTSIGTAVTGNKIFYANWEALAEGSVTLSAGTGGQVSKDNSNWSSSATITGITSDQAVNIYARPSAGYTFNTWTKTAGTGSIKTNAASGAYNAKAYSAEAVTASFTETKVTLTPSVSYDHGTSTYTASADNTIGVATASRIKCSKPNANHYTFAGWTLTNLTVTSGNASTDTIIYVKVNNPANACSAVANYEEVLAQSTYVFKGGTGVTSGDGWLVGQAMNKKSGYSTSSIVYYTANISATNTSSDNPDTYGFKIYIDGTPYGLPADGDSYWWTSETSGAQTLSTSGKNIQIRANAAGLYEIKVDYTTPASPKVTVTFPTSYQVNYEVGTVKGASGDPSAEDDESNDISDGDLVLSGTEVTFTAEDAADGYTWEGWYDAATTSGTKLSTDDDLTYTTTISAATTIYAVYSENSYTITVNASSGGKVSYGTGDAGSSCSASAGVATASSTIHAIPDAGYAFVGWTNVDEDHHITKYTATWNNTNKGWDLTVNADDNTTITANFEPRFALAGAIDATGNPAGGMPSPTWDVNNAAAFTYSAGTYTISRTLTSPNTTYAFKIIDRRAETWIWRGFSDADNNLAVDNTTTYTLTESGGNNVYFDTKGVGSYTFTVVEETITGVVYPKVKIQDGTNSHSITWGYVSDNGQEGGTITSVVDGEDTPNSIASGKYVKNGGSITATAAANPGYRFIDFRTSSTYGGGSQLSTSNPYTVASVEADQNIYAQFAENKCTVTIKANDKTKGSITVGGDAFAWDGTTAVGVYTTKALVVTPVDGYYFSGWTLSSTPDFEVDDDGESGASTTLRGLGGTHGSTGTLTANFAELDKIYFRNIFDDGAGSVTHWENVYVYFDVAWDTSHDPSWGVWYATGKVRTQMTQIEETDVYWAYVPRAYTSGNLTHVAFSEQAFTANLNFRTGNAAFRSDYNKLLNMFVPHHTKSSTQTYSSYTTNYYSNGYWMKYDTRAGQGAGYYLKKYDGRNSYSLDSVFRATNDDATFIQCRIRVDGTEDSNNKYMIVSAAGLNYITDSTITSLRNTKGVSEDTRTLTANDVYFQVKATSEGFYTFILDQSGDKMKLTVDYPVSPGDYRLKHTYVGRNKANSADSTYITYSDIIKASDAASGATVSMFLSTAGTKTLVLQECTSINGTTKLPEWNAGESDGLSGVFTKVGTDGDGVYQFDVIVNTSTNKVTATENIALYDGPFYIKTDCAPGGWANYTRNEMDKNTANPTAFDYYFMKWIDLDTDKNEKKNIKCVIANQYNNAISDTLKSDGIATMDGTEPVLDNDGSVRFSYNTKTNTLKRAYLTGAAKLTLETYEAKKIYWPSTSSDQYGSHPGFVDDVVWTYELTVDAKLGAKAGVKAAWTNKAGNDKEEMLIANTNPIISGTGSGTYRMRLVFDFKTNTLISSWTPSGEITDALSDVDVMLVRERQAASDVITFGDGGSLAPRKLVGSLKFEKKNYFGKVASWSETTRPLLTFFVSFPFDVKVSDVFGLNSAYGDAYVIRKYDGAERASKGFFRGDGTTSFWKDLTTDDTMNAYEGYIVVLDNDYFNDNTYDLWGSKSELYLYFPSSKGGTIATGTKTIQVPSHPCTIDRTFDGGKNHKNTDSHWNLIGVPVFTTYDDGGSPESGTPGAVFAETEGAPDAFNYFYEWDSTRNEFAISAAKNYEFKAMHGYMVQYTGDVTFTGSVFTPASVAARRTVEKKNYDIELQVLNSENEMLNRTYVALREEASNEFVLNEDVYLSPNNRDAEIYTFAGDYDVAANRLPVEDQVVRMGLNVHKAGVYTISMPSTFSGTATLVDTYTSTRTNLAIDEYEVNLPKGACDDRFLLELNIHKVPTAIDGVDGGSLKDGNAHKFIMNDRMYILKNGVIYDACGIRVQ